MTAGLMRLSVLCAVCPLKRREAEKGAPHVAAERGAPELVLGPHFPQNTARSTQPLPSTAPAAAGETHGLGGDRAGPGVSSYHVGLSDAWLLLVTWWEETRWRYGLGQGWLPEGHMPLACLLRYSPLGMPQQAGGSVLHKNVSCVAKHTYHGQPSGSSRKVTDQQV